MRLVRIGHLPCAPRPVSAFASACDPAKVMHSPRKGREPQCAAHGLNGSRSGQLEVLNQDADASEHVVARGGGPQNGPCRPTDSTGSSHTAGPASRGGVSRICAVERMNPLPDRHHGYPRVSDSLSAAPWDPATGSQPAEQAGRPVLGRLAAPAGPRPGSKGRWPTIAAARAAHAQIHRLEPAYPAPPARSRQSRPQCWLGLQHRRTRAGGSGRRARGAAASCLKPASTARSIHPPLLPAL